MRIPSGDAVHRAYAVRVGGEELVVVEVENRSPAPVALAFAIRPYGVDSLTEVRRIDLVDDTVVAVDGRVVMVLPRRPNRVAVSTAAMGDVAEVVLAGDAGDAFDPVDDPAGLATAVFIWPLPHRTVLRVALPLAPVPVKNRARIASSVVELPGAEQVAKGWKVHGSRGIRLVLPDDRLTECVDANRRHLLNIHDLLRSVDSLPGASGPDAATVLGALDRFGFASEVAAIVGRYPEQLRQTGQLIAGAEGADGDGAALHALAEHWLVHRDRKLVRELAPLVATVAESIGRAGSRRRWERRAEGGGSPWPVAGLRAAATLLSAAGEERAAGDARSMGAAAGAAFERGFAGVGVAGSATLAACWPLHLLAADDARVQAALDVRRQGAGAAGSDAWACSAASGEGFDVRRTIELALVEVEAGDRRALERLRWLLEAATPTWTWPSVVHPRLRSGSAGDGHDIVAAAGVLTFVRQLLVRDAPGGLALVSLVPDSWLGRGLEVHDAPTTHGVVSYAVRWHGDRPAIFWELTPHESEGGQADGVQGVGVRLTAPGLDREWSSTELSGEVLLNPVPVPATATPVGLSPRRR
jgi:hypothetical protein